MMIKTTVALVAAFILANCAPVGHEHNPITEWIVEEIEGKPKAVPAPPPESTIEKIEGEVKKIIEDIKGK